MAGLTRELEEDSSNFIEMDLSGREEEEEGQPEPGAVPASNSPLLTDPPPTSDTHRGNTSPERISNGRSKPSAEQLKQTSLQMVEGVRPAPLNNPHVKPPQPPKSSYYFGPPTSTAAYGTDPIGTIGLHHPREIVRVERDYEHGELCQFSSAFPLELEGRLTPTQFLETINAINEILISAHSVKAAAVDNTVAIMTLYLSTFLRKTHYQKEMERLKQLFEHINIDLFQSRGLRLLWPRRIGFLFLEIEFY